MCSGIVSSVNPFYQTSSAECHFADGCSSGHAHLIRLRLVDRRQKEAGPSGSDARLHLNNVRLHCKWQAVLRKLFQASANFAHHEIGGFDRRAYTVILLNLEAEQDGFSDVV